MLSKANLFSVGTLEYDHAWEFQKKLLAKRILGTVADTVLLLEHPHTITLGRSGNRRHLRVSPKTLARMGIPVVHVKRGGDITYHGPGQAVLYPVLHLRECGLGLVEYLDRLEELVISVLGDFGIEGRHSVRNRGVWVGDDKIASIRIAVRKWVSFHGVALNCNTDLEYFRLIDPCGLEGIKMTSISQVLGTPISKSDLNRSVDIHLRRLFKRDWQEMKLPQLETLLNGIDS